MLQCDIEVCVCVCMCVCVCWLSVCEDILASKHVMS